MASASERIRLESMTWEEAEQAFTDADFVALPCGSTEQHGPHLPLSVDSIRAQELTTELARRAPEFGLEIVVLPTLRYGYCEEHLPFSGTVTLQPETYRRMIVEIGQSVAKHGCDRLLLVNAHLSNQNPLELAADRLQRTEPLSVHVVRWTQFADELLAELFTNYGHAGPHETSMVEHFEPGLVRDDKKATPELTDQPATRRIRYFDELTEQGHTADPTQSDPDAIVEVIDETTQRILETLKQDLTLTER